jgi:hypothetical protein
MRIVVSILKIIFDFETCYSNSESFYLNLKINNLNLNFKYELYIFYSKKFESKIII